MKQTTQLFLLLTIFGFALLPACGAQPVTGNIAPNADHLVKFNKDGFAQLRGRVRSGGFTTDTSVTLNESINIAIPVKVEGIETGLIVPFVLSFETEFSSSTTQQTNVRAYHSAHPTSAVQAAFPASALVDVTFRKKDTVFEAVAIHEVTKKPLFQKQPAIDQVFSTDLFSQATIKGDITQALTKQEGDITWLVSIPITMQGIQVAVLLSIDSAPDTQVITSNGSVPVSDTPWHNLQIQFTRKGDLLIADQLIVLP
jgi:hypothetical protein